MNRNCSDEVEKKNGRATVHGYSYCELWHNGERIGEMVCGAVNLTHPDYSMIVTKMKTFDGLMTDVTRVDIFVEVSDSIDVLPI